MIEDCLQPRRKKRSARVATASASSSTVSALLEVSHDRQALQIELSFTLFPFAGNLCEGCMCRDCLNAPGNEGFVMSERSKILARNPQAFSVKVEQAGEDSSHKTGCRCRKSRCVKKYCECFDGGVRCNPNCRSVDHSSLSLNNQLNLQTNDL